MIFARTLRISLYFLLLLSIIAIIAYAYLKTVIYPQLPPTDGLHNIHMQEPLRVYSKDGAALAEFGDERRKLLKFEEIPELMIQAILSIEDARFYQHHGVDFHGVVRAGVSFIKSGFKARQGASTITMQLTRNLFPKSIGREKKLERKFKEMLVAWEIEKILSKNKILELYLNTIFLGHRAYGFGSAANIYYDKELDQLTLAQYAMLAGLPKAPSANNPLRNPKRALERRNYILKRMQQLGFIDTQGYEAAIAAPITAKRYRFSKDFDAPYVAEMVRTYMLKNYPEDAYTGGYRVYTSIDTPLQKAAQQAVRKNLFDYDHRHGYRGAIAQIAIEDLLPPATDNEQQALTTEAVSPQEQHWQKILEKYAPKAGLTPALVLAVENQSAQAYTWKHEQVTIPWSGLKWATPYINDSSRGPTPKTAADVLTVGDIVFLKPAPQKVEKKVAKKPTETTQEDTEASTEDLSVPLIKYWHLAQIPQVEGALVSLNPKNGAILALSGGFNFYHSKFNRIIQARRQPGSNFKPFVYSAALDHGYTPASTINDAPVVFTDYKGKVWKPNNYSHHFTGPTRMRKALAKSLNLISIRMMHEIGVQKALDYATRFGFERHRLPPNLTLALGTPELTPLEIIRGFAVFANGGYRIKPWFIERIENPQGKILYQANPQVVCRSCDLPLEVDEKAALPMGLAALLKEKTVEEIEIAKSPVFEPDPQNNSKPDSEANQPQYAPRIITPQNAWLMTSMLKSVITEGTAVRAKRLKRNDLAGKTGTTNDQHDAWFSGFNADIVTTAWVGFDQPRSLGRVGRKRETGSSAALPMWIHYMRVALAGKPQHNLPRPAGIVTLRIDPETGLLARPEQSNAISEYFERRTAPTRYAQKMEDLYMSGQGPDDAGSPDADQLF
ncbi:penicillin-binding protein 1A [Candidatus Venteria ishoeyi]|nr:penicillin-binding protein 1A [Candidatus Venteria ishoeyi]